MEPVAAPRRPDVSFTASLVRVIDGDTAILDVLIPATLDISGSVTLLGFGARATLTLTFTLHCRIRGYNARESKDAGGREAGVRLAELLAGVLTLTEVQPDKYGGRVNAVVVLADGRRVDAVMCAEGFGAPWDGQGPKPVPVWPRP